MTTDTDTAGAPQSAGWRGKFAGFALALSVFAVLWFVAAAVGTKLGLWEWQFGLGVMTITWGPLLLMAAAGVSVLAVIVSLIRSPRKQAFMLAFAALLISGLAFGRVAAFGGQAARLPPLHDIQTDWSNPIQPSDVLLTAREFTGALNPIETDPVIDESVNARWPGMGGRRVAEVQEEAEFDTATHKSPKETPYPLIAPLTAPVTVEAAYEAALAAVEGRGWTIVTASPEEGVIEATETSFWFGFHDDVMIRILSAEEEVVIDVRSTSRVGLSDLGANAKRIRNLLDEIETRLNKVSDR
jgi:fatty-acyl-CoA synthase